MTTNLSQPVDGVNVRGIELLAADTREQYRQKLARITLDSMVHFVSLLDVNGTVLEMNQVALDAAGVRLSDVEGKPFWTTCWWQVTEEVQATLRESILRASQGEFVRWDTEVYAHVGGKETIMVDVSFMPVRDERDNVVFITAEARDITRADVLQTQFFERPLQNARQHGARYTWIAEADGLCSSVSRGWYDYTGQSGEAALGFGWLSVVHPDDRDETRRIILEAINKREAFSLDCRLRRADGEHRWVLNSGQPRFNPDGAFAGFAGSVIDIHERKQAAQAAALLSAIVDSSDDAIISKDLTGTIMSWNRSAERLFGYTAAEAIGRSIVMLIPPDRLQEEPEILERLKRGERVDHYETVRVRRDGSRLNISLTISPLKGADGRIVGASKIARDITERVRQQEALKAVNAALQQANADLQQFAYSASHDLQEPLRMVATYSRMLQRKFGGKLGPMGDEYIRYTVAGATRAEKLLRDLRTYTQVSTADLGPLEEIDAGEVLRKTLVNLDVAIKESGASIVSADLPRVRIHGFQLEQVFQNLIGNAIHYRSKLPPCIRIAAVSGESEWLFSVQDNGIGIAPEYQAQIFEIFERLHTASEYPGSGMGLAICQRIIERGGGRIWVESELGRGSTFYFTIPFRS